MGCGRHKSSLKEWVFPLLKQELTARACIVFDTRGCPTKFDLLLVARRRVVVAFEQVVEEASLDLNSDQLEEGINQIYFQRRWVVWFTLILLRIRILFLFMVLMTVIKKFTLVNALDSAGGEILFDKMFPVPFGSSPPASSK